MIYTIFWVVLIVIILFVVIYYFACNMKALFLSGWVPSVSTFDRDIKFIKDSLNLDSNKVIYDLWCGTGKALRFFVKNFNLKKWVGYDLNSSSIILWKIINKFKNIENIQLIRWNFKDVCLKEAQYIYLYLLPGTMKNIENWIFENISDDALIISNAFAFKNREPFKVFKNKDWVSKVFFYKK